MLIWDRDRDSSATPQAAYFPPGKGRETVQAGTIAVDLSVFSVLIASSFSQTVRVQGADQILQGTVRVRTLVLGAPKNAFNLIDE